MKADTSGLWPGLDTRAVHAGTLVDPVSGAVVEPITMSVTFERDSDGGHRRGYHYGSAGNPNRSSLEAAVAALEGASDALAYSTGSAAIAAVLHTVGADGHVLIPDDVFQGTVRLLNESLARWGVSYSSVDMADLGAVERAMRPETRLLWCETLSNPLLKVTDVEAVAALAHKHGAICAVDNTFVTPALQQPLSLGADYVVHATTKYIAGHADVLGGILVAAETSDTKELRSLQWVEGAVPGAFDCWLTRRGLKTLPIRMRAHSASARSVAAHLQSHAAVIAVHYPGLPDHPQHGLATRLLDGFGGIVSFRVRGGPQVAIGVAAQLRVFTQATSFGAPESLVQHQASAPTHGVGTGLHDDLLRLSIGLEDTKDLIADLDQALANVDEPRAAPEETR